jgi:xanthine dehydrogenase accessory factor
MTLPTSTPSLYAILADCQARGEAAVLAIIVATQGSTPQKIGAKMVVRADGPTVGTVGGGLLESRVKEAAQDVLRAGQPKMLEVDLTTGEEGICGGRVSVYLEPVLPPPSLLILGAGHVGQALAALAAFVGLAVTLADTRDLQPAPALPGVRWHKLQDYHQPFADLPKAAEEYIVIATASHHYDLEALRAALRTPAKYIGLLGSNRKKSVFAQQLLAEGFAPEDLARVHAPVGLDLGAVTPAEIAVSITAQLIALRRNHATTHFSSAPCRRLLHPDGTAEGPAPSPR